MQRGTLRIWARVVKPQPFNQSNTSFKFWLDFAVTIFHQMEEEEAKTLQFPYLELNRALHLSNNMKGQEIIKWRKWQHESRKNITFQGLATIMQQHTTNHKSLDPAEYIYNKKWNKKNSSRSNGYAGRTYILLWQIWLQIGSK